MAAAMPDSAGRCAVLAVANSKGGVGKSTLAVNIAVQAACEGRKVLLVDTDPQASSTLFAGARGELEERPQISVSQMTKPILHRELPKLCGAYDLAVIDTAGRESETFRSALRASDVILIPVAPSAFDIWASEDVFAMAEEVGESREHLQTRVVLNQVVPRTRIAGDALDALLELTAGPQIELLDTRVHFRVAWKMAVGAGLGVSEWEPRGEAAREIREIWSELAPLLATSTNP